MFSVYTVDSLVTVRKLKEKGVEVYFEKENIYTLDSKGELLITIMSSLAQEESRSISENVTWGQRKRFADGKVSFAYSRFLGYKRGEDGIPQIIEEEAEIVRRIYSLFMSGKTACSIARLFTKEGIPTPAGKQRWQVSTIESILTNEKYRGAALLQKKFTVDFLAKKMKVNEGEVPQYYVEHSHEPIIDPEEFERVQTEFTRRKAMGRSYSSNGVFASRIVCGDCGEFYGSKVWHSTDKYRRTIWQCNAKFKNGERCRTPHFDEETIKARFITAFNTLLESRASLLDDCRLMQTELTDCSAIDAELSELYQEMDVVSELTKKSVEQNSQSAQSQEEYIARYNTLVKRYDAAKTKTEALQRKRTDRMAQADAMGGFMFELSEQDEVLTEFDDKLWLATIEKATAYHDGRLVFTFKNSLDIGG